jgi:nucleotide-binding universal stress UspA family protein
MYKKILLPVDLNHEESWRAALPAATALCQAFGADLHVMTVVPSMGMALVGSFFPKDYEEKALAEADKALKAFLGDHLPEDVQGSSSVAHGTVYEEILKTAQSGGFDLVVMAAHRPELQDYLIGPNAARVVRHGKTSVLVVRG